MQESPPGEGSEKEDGDGKDKSMMSLDSPPEMESDQEDLRHTPSPVDDVIADTDDEIDIESETGRT